MNLNKNLNKMLKHKLKLLIVILIVLVMVFPQFVLSRCVQSCVNSLLGKIICVSLILYVACKDMNTGLLLTVLFGLVLYMSNVSEHLTFADFETKVSNGDYADMEAKMKAASTIEGELSEEETQKMATLMMPSNNP